MFDMSFTEENNHPSNEEINVLAYIAKIYVEKCTLLISRSRINDWAKKTYGYNPIKTFRILQNLLNLHLITEQDEMFGLSQNGKNWAIKHEAL